MVVTPFVLVNWAFSNLNKQAPHHRCEGLVQYVGMFVYVCLYVCLFVYSVTWSYYLGVVGTSLDRRDLIKTTIGVCYKLQP